MMNGHPRADSLVCCGVLALLLGVSEPSAAQSSSDLADCAAIEIEADRLACYDAVLRPGVPHGADAAAQPQQAEPSSAAQAPEAVAPLGPGPAGRTAGTDDSADADDLANADGSANAGTAAVGGDADDRRSSSQRQSERAHESVVVVAVRENLSGMSVFTTDTGVVYEQTSGRRARRTDPPFTALLEPATFGSFFLIPADESQRIRVSRRN